MAYWLFKTEPETWSWEQQKKKNGAEPWSGVRNWQAARNMKDMKTGDLGFFYHSGAERQIVGVVTVTGEYRKDPTDETGKFGLVEVTYKEEFKRPVTLAEIKADPRFKEMVLVRNSRLSVQPVTAAQWKMLCTMGGAKG
jgi:predicted RNA-binding protein with PUA-like domain